MLKRRDHTFQRALLVVAERQELVQHLRVRVQPAAFGGRAVHAPVVLAQRPLLAMVAVHLGAGRDQYALAEAVAVVEDDLRSLDVRDQRVHRLLDDQADADRCGQVVDDIALVDELGHDGRGQHRVHHEVEVGMVAEVRDILDRAGREVVEHEHFRARARGGARPGASR